MSTVKRASSKYDFVKLRVHLSTQHYYVLSRFLLSRMLTAIKIPVQEATGIALDLKKRLVDQGMMEVSQLELERALFQLMAERGFGTRSIRLFWTLNRLHHQRIPLVILVGGAGCVGKSTLATQLSERLNLANTLQTNLICDMTRSLLGLPEDDYWHARRDGKGCDKSAPDTDASTLVRRGLEIELRKCLSSGKSIIVEGEHVNAALLDFVQRCLADERASRTRPTSTLINANATSSMPANVCAYASEKQPWNATSTPSAVDTDGSQCRSNDRNPDDDLTLSQDVSLHNDTSAPFTLTESYGFAYASAAASSSSTSSSSSSLASSSVSMSPSSTTSSSWEEEDAPMGIVVPLLLTVTEPAFHRELIEDAARTRRYSCSTDNSDIQKADPLAAIVQCEQSRQQALLLENAQRAPSRQFITLARNKADAPDTLDQIHEAVLARILALI